jgi:Farnesoic acid 0-methyl transferase
MFSLRTSDSESRSSQWLTFQSSRKSVTFDVRACSNVRLQLSQVAFRSPQYEVVLGTDNNSKSQILQHSGSGSATIVAEEDTPGIVSCSESRRFTLRWMANTVQVLTGSSAGRVIVDWTSGQGSFAVFAVGLATGPGSVGEWKFSFDQG